MQKRQCCTWGTVFSPVPSEGRTAQGMDCEDLSEKYSHLHKTPVSVVPTSMEGNVKILFLSCKFVWTKPAKKERLSHASQAERPRDEVDMEVDGNISREAGRLRIFRGS